MVPAISHANVLTVPAGPLLDANPLSLPPVGASNG
jgi:hypothetical protein